ncbi:hypothetical protein QL285_070051 [Trifolium repens]|nr:hypothetical protein QL285_070051 [Trifolium repens]
MPPRRQPRHDLELEDLRAQIQQLQETVDAQQILLDEYQRQSEVDTSSSDSSVTRHCRPPRRSARSDDIRVKIPDFEGKLQPDEFVDWLQTVERVFEYKRYPKKRR